MENLELEFEPVESNAHRAIEVEEIATTLMKSPNGQDDPEFFLYTGENLIDSMRKTNEKLRSIINNIAAQKHFA